MPESRPCNNCGTTFNKKNWIQRYCSHACQQERYANPSASDARKWGLQRLKRKGGSNGRNG